MAPDAQNSQKNSRAWGKPFKPGQSGNPGGRPKKKAAHRGLRSYPQRRVPADVVRKLGLKGHPTYAEMIALAFGTRSRQREGACSGRTCGPRGGQDRDARRFPGEPAPPAFRGRKE